MFSIKFTDNEGKVIKTYTTIEVKAGKMDIAFGLLDDVAEIKGGKDTAAWRGKMKAFLVSVFGDKFTVDDIDANVSNKELVRCWQSIVRAQEDAVAKNSEGEPNE